MCTMDASLLRLVTEKRVSKETALTHCMHYEAMEKRLSDVYKRQAGKLPPADA